MAASLTIELARLIALCLELIFYGMYIVLSIYALYILLFQRRRINRPMIIALFAMSILITAHLIIDIDRAATAFTTSVDAATYFDSAGRDSEMAKDTILVTLTVVADAIVLFRCWIVWSGNIRVMVVPMIFYSACICTGIGTCWAFAAAKSSFFSWGLSFFVLTFILNGISTLLIASRIWHTSKAVEHIRTGRAMVWRLTRILVESAALYSCFIAAMIGTFASKGTPQFIVLDTLSPVVGIVCGLIIVRVGLGISSDGTPGWGTEERSDSRVGAIYVRSVGAHMSEQETPGEVGTPLEKMEGGYQDSGNNVSL